MGKGEKIMCNDNYKRSETLKKKLNEFVSKFTKEEKDYFEDLSSKQLLGLKSALAYINNYLTLKTTVAMGKWLAKYFKLSNKEEEALLKKIDEIKPNSNGYDIELNNRLKIIVEVKCIVPINDGDTFGAAQKNSILDDALKLKKGKKSIPNTEKYIKLIGLLDIGEKTEKAIKKLLHPTGMVGSEKKDRREIVEELVLIDNLTKHSDLSTKNIYIKPISID